MDYANNNYMVGSSSELDMRGGGHGQDAINKDETYIDVFQFSDISYSVMITLRKKVDAELIASREKIFKALSDRTRLEIVEFLKDGEKCVCEIIPSIGKAQSTTSKNLDVLFRAGILERLVDGKKTLYSIKHAEIFTLIRDADSLSLKNLSSISETVKALKKSVQEK